MLASNKQAHDSQPVGAVFKNLTTDQIREFLIPIPDLDAQRAIVAGIAEDQRLVDTNKELIRCFGEKTKQIISRMWGKAEQPSWTRHRVGIVRRQATRRVQLRLADH